MNSVDVLPLPSCPQTAAGRPAGPVCGSSVTRPWAEAHPQSHRWVLGGVHVMIRQSIIFCTYAPFDINMQHHGLGVVCGGMYFYEALGIYNTLPTLLSVTVTSSESFVCSSGTWQIFLSNQIFNIFLEISLHFQLCIYAAKCMTLAKWVIPTTET